jgi:hypothetical protein
MGRGIVRRGILFLPRIDVFAHARPRRGKHEQRERGDGAREDRSMRPRRPHIDVDVRQARFETFSLQLLQWRQRTGFAPKQRSAVFERRRERVEATRERDPVIARRESPQQMQRPRMPRARLRAPRAIRRRARRAR